MILFKLIGGKDIGPSIGLVSSWPPSVWIALTLDLTVETLMSFFC